MTKIYVAALYRYVFVEDRIFDSQLLISIFLTGLNQPDIVFFSFSRQFLSRMEPIDALTDHESVDWTFLPPYLFPQQHPYYTIVRHLQFS